MPDAIKPRRTKTVPPAEIAIVGELYDDGEAEIVKALLEVKRGKPVHLYIDSGGGSVYAALTIAGLIRHRELDAAAFVMGECSSSALLIFAACKRRFVTPRSTFLFHQIRWRGDRELRSMEASQWASHYEWLEKEVDAYQASLLGMAADRMQDWTLKGRFVLGTEFVELGIAELIDV